MTTRARVEPSWGRFVAGAVRVLAARGASFPGADLGISSSVPAGSGLSSSSALAVALTLALADLGGLRARVARRRARSRSPPRCEATGVPGGLMDQLAALFGRAGHALLIDCRTNSIQPVPIAADVAVVVVHCGLPRTLADSAYAARRAECEAVAAAARDRLAARRDARPGRRRPARPPRRHRERAGRSRPSRRSQSGDLAALGPLLSESHASLRDDYEVSTPELDLLVAHPRAERRRRRPAHRCRVRRMRRRASRAAPTPTTCSRESITRYGAATGLVATGFLATAVDGART